MDNTGNHTLTFILGMMAGMFMFAFVWTMTNEGVPQAEFDLCEATLKRTEHCKLIAVPETEQDVKNRGE